MKLRKDDKIYIEERTRLKDKQLTIENDPICIYLHQQLMIQYEKNDILDKKIDEKTKEMRKHWLWKWFELPTK